MRKLLTFFLFFTWILGLSAPVLAKSKSKAKKRVPLSVAQQVNQQAHFHSQKIERWNQKSLKVQSKILKSNYQNHSEKTVQNQKRKRNQYEKNKSRILHNWMANLNRILKKIPAKKMKQKLAQYMAAYKNGEIQPKNIDEFAFCFKQEINDFTKGHGNNRKCTRLL